MVSGGCFRDFRLFVDRMVWVLVCHMEFPGFLVFQACVGTGSRGGGWKC